jgi:hypothetical protein
VNHWSANPDLDEIEQSLRERYLNAAHRPAHYVVRFIGTTGDIGRRCLTFNIEVCEEQFTLELKFLEQLVEGLRTKGWSIDELRQPLSAKNHFNARLWLMIYEESVMSKAAGDTSL